MSDKLRKPRTYIRRNYPQIRFDDGDTAGLPLEILGEWHSVKDAKKLYKHLGDFIAWIEQKTK